MTPANALKKGLTTMRLGLGLGAKASRLRDEAQILLSNRLWRPNLFNPKSAERIGAVYWKPSDMCEPDKIMLYAIVRGFHPERVLEIGARWGSGARIISSALEDTGFGKAVGIDPETAAFRPTASDLFGRYELINGYSPEAIPLAVERLGGAIDLAFIDAMHTHDHVLADLRGVLPHIREGGHILLHDTFHAGINAAITKTIASNPSLFDCGFITRHPTINDDAPVAYQGLRLIRKGHVSGEALISQAFAEKGRTADMSPSIYNWDYYWNRVKPGNSFTINC